MAVVSKNPINSIFSLKNLLLSISAVFMACLLKIYAPLIFEVFVSGVPVLTSWFTPPFVCVLINFIIIAIAASSRFQQRMEEGMSELVGSAKVHHTLIQKETYDVLGRKTSTEYKPDFGAMEPEMYGHLDNNQKQSTGLEVNSRTKAVDAKIEAYDFEVKPKKKPVETMEAKMKRNSVEPKKKVVVLKPKKYENIEAKNLKVNYMMERSAKESEDEYSHAKTEKMPNRGNTIEIPMDYSPDERNVSNRLNYQEHDEETLQAGKEVSAAEGEEENDTLDGTWKMIMESRRIHEAALQQEASEMRSPSHSRKKQDTYNY